ncbi:MAG: nucleoside-diphosphate sugar epimerase/dehydratase [Desulfotomaculaceae bacterium]
MNNHLRTLLLLLCDAVLVSLATVVPYILRFYDSEHTLYQLQGYLLLITLNTVVLLAVFYAFKLYHRAWAYASLGELMAIVQAVTLGSFGTIVLSYFAQMSQPRSVVVMQWAFAVLMVGGSRLTWRMLVEKQKINVNNRDHRMLIIGAGDAGAMVARESRSDKANFLPVGFVDDDPNKQNLRVLGLPVLGTRQDIPELVNRHKVDLIIIAMPAVDGSIIREIVEICRGTEAELKILPGMYQIIEGKVSVSRLRPVQLEDLLRREPVQVDLEEISGYLRGETVLITGAGGSIGSELCRQVTSFGPGRLVLLDHSENSIHKTWMELEGSSRGVPISIEIADVKDKRRINSIFEKHRPGVVFHAAAHKHVPLMELHPAEAVKTNIFGTRNVAFAASRVGTKFFVMISSDKAVNPSSVMGATKRMAELIIHQENLISDTIFTAVRFGNVLGSNGSVVPVFQRQIATGGPVTVTHPDMKRYFMTIPEAVQLVIQAAAMARGGEVFVLDMGEPVKIVDLAKDIIELSGLKPDRDINIIFTGIRPGEKLFEEILTAEEGSCATRHKRIFVAKPSLVEVAALEAELVNLLRKGLQCSAEDIFEALYAIVPSFKRYKQPKVG